MDVTRPETGKVRLELKWNDLTTRWQEAFEEPILDALRIYFEHDALTPVMEDDVVDSIEVLPSRFVLVNKSDPRNLHPSDDQLEGAKLKARWSLPVTRTKRPANMQQNPTASLLAHNLLCFLGGTMRCTLRTSVQPEGRRVFIQSPRSYPHFVRKFLLKQLPKKEPEPTYSG